jgi:hypothetical protein
MPGEGLSSYIDLLSATYPSVRVWLTPSEQKRNEIRAQQVVVEADEKSEI